MRPVFINHKARQQTHLRFKTKRFSQTTFRDEKSTFFPCTHTNLLSQRLIANKQQQTDTKWKKS